MNGFEQIKSFYSWVFNNPEKVRPTHVSLYLFLWNQANRANWAEWIKCPYDLAMQGACIGNRGTYYKCLNDLQAFHLIRYQPGQNNHKAPLISLIQLYDCDTTTGQQTGQVTVPLSEQLDGQQTGQLPVHIYKLLTNNIKPITDNYTVVETFFKSLQKKQGKKSKRGADELVEYYDKGSSDYTPTVLTYPFSSPEFMQVWGTLIKEPKWKKKTFSALQASLEQLSKYDEQDAIQVMKKSIAGGYQGLFEIKTIKNGSLNGQPKKESKFSQLSKM